LTDPKGEFISSLRDPGFVVADSRMEYYGCCGACNTSVKEAIGGRQEAHCSPKSHHQYAKIKLLGREEARNLMFDWLSNRRRKKLTESPFFLYAAM